MKKLLHFGLFVGVLTMLVGMGDSVAAIAKTKKQSAISMGTKVRTRVEANGVYDEECYNKYYGCMDQFCISENENGGTCTCSDDATKYEEELENIKKCWQRPNVSVQKKLKKFRPVPMQILYLMVVKEFITKMALS